MDTLAAELQIESLADLPKHAPRLKVGGDNQIFLRQEWRDLCGQYGLRFAEQKAMDLETMRGANERADVEGQLPHRVGVQLLDELEARR